MNVRTKIRMRTRETYRRVASVQDTITGAAMMRKNFKMSIGRTSIRNEKESMHILLLPLLQSWSFPNKLIRQSNLVIRPKNPTATLEREMPKVATARQRPHGDVHGRRTASALP